MERIPMTAEGHAALQAELKVLKSVERPSIIAAISEARSHGDLSENAEYHAAKEKQSFIEGRISELDDKLEFNRGVEGQNRDSNGTASVPSRVTKDLDQQVARAIGDTRLTREFGLRRDENNEFDDAGHAIDRSDGGLDSRERVQHRGARVSLSVVGRHGRTDLARSR
jgi:hypothetical protein